MENTYQHKYIVLPSMTDHRARMSLEAMMNIFMDVATVHASLLGVGAGNILQRGLFWLTTKTMVHVKHYPKLMDEITVTTWPLKAEGLRCYRDYTISLNDEVIVTGKSQWAVWNALTNSLHPLEDVFPADLVFSEEDCCPQDFSIIDKDFSAALTIGSHTVKSGDIDLGGHNNNVAYVHGLFNCFTTKQLNEMKIRHLEINFLNQSFEGEKLTYLMKENENGKDIEAIKEDGRIAILAKIY